MHSWAARSVRRTAIGSSGHPSIKNAEPKNFKGDSKMTFFSRCIPVFLALLTLGLIACGGAASEAPAATTASDASQQSSSATTTEETTSSPSEEVTLRVGTGFLSAIAPPTRTTAVAMGIGETLFRLGEGYRPVPWLATEAKNLDEKTWEISLRQGVKFHNGVEMDAAAVKASLERAFQESASIKALLNTASIEVKDANTLIIVTNRPSPIFPSLLTAGRTAIVEVGAAQPMGKAFNEKPVLTGPFKVERFQSGKELVAVRNDDYWGDRPLVDRLVVTHISDNNSLILALQAGDIDIARGIPPHSVETLEAHPDLVVRRPAQFQLNFMFLNTQSETMKDVKVRQAISHAINREALVKGVMLGQAIPAVGPFPPNFLSCDGLRGRAFEPPVARELLSTAGYEDSDGDGILEKNGQPLEINLLTYGQGGFLPPMAEAIQVMLKDIGMKVAIRTVERIDAVLEEGDWDASMFNNNMVHTGDSYGTLFSFADPSSYLNKSNYQNPRLDEILTQMYPLADREERRVAGCAASQEIIDDVPVVPILHQNYDYGVSKSVIGFDNPYPYFLYLIDSKIGKR
jgi:peptide/nickel transport system substrate-binding protein